MAYNTKEIARKIVENNPFPTFLINYENASWWRWGLLLLRLRFEIWRMKTFRLFKPPIDNGAI